MPAILFDLDGVLYEGDKAIIGAAAAINWFELHNIPHLFLTNTSSKPRSALVEKLASLGIQIKSKQLFTPPLAAVQWLKQNTTGSIALFIPEATQEEFLDFEVASNDDADVSAVVIGDMGEQWDFKTLNRAFLLLLNNPDAKLIALGMTRYWRAKDGIQLDAGPFVSALSYATGKEPVVTGKPAITFFQVALDVLDVNSNEAVMIGDDIKGDIQAAQQAGLKSILVQTGKFKSSDLELGIKPDAVIDTINDLVSWWTANIN